ncbi:SH3 domain-containing protein [Dysosmobacter sp.]|uniref:SH3 domain-containing protein n=1 Tax=Dysosmobacter sp. TaxID=2591382 RepID=UPI003AF92FE0
MGKKKTEHTQKPAKKPAQDALQTIQEAQEPQTAQTDQEPMQTAQTDQEPMQAAQDTQEQSQAVQTGIDLGDPALSGISGDIVAVNAEGGLNLRIGPGRSYPVAEVLENGTLLTVLYLPHGAEVPGWALVHTGERTGWVDRLFIQELEETEEE